MTRSLCSEKLTESCMEKCCFLDHGAWKLKVISIKMFKRTGKDFFT